MTNKKYDDMKAIMQFCRIFSEQMYTCLKNSGLLKEGYELHLRIGSLGKAITSMLELENNNLGIGEDEWHENRMEQFKFSGEPWIVYDDPIAKRYSVLPVVKLQQAESEGTESHADDGAEDGEKPYPPFDMWISSADDHPDVACWEQMT